MIDNDDYHEKAHQLRPIIDKERKLINNTGCDPYISKLLL